MVSDLKRLVLADIEREVMPVARNADGRVVRISALLARDPKFLEVARSEVVVGPLLSLLGENIEILTNRHNHATLNLKSQADDFHRDNMQWSRGLLTVIFYLETTTQENGCTQLVPGSHLLPGVGQHHRLSDVDWVNGSGLFEQAVQIPVEAGGMLAIDSTIFHRIGGNQTDGSRISMTIGYQSVDEFNDQENPKRILISGDRIYSGNDRGKA